VDGSTVRLRVATPADASRVDELMKTSTAALFPAHYDQPQTASAIRYIAQPDPMLLTDGTYFVLETDDELVACGGWSKRAKPYMGSAEEPGGDRLLDPSTEAGHVRAMFVRPSWTRRGLGRRIIEACESAARDAGFRRLDLVATLPGVLLYDACGFVATADVEDITLEDGVRLACLAMTKELAPAG
jgi:GNAT superfamily N-acetyltransferase